MATVKNVKVAIQTGTDRTLYATWDWTKSSTTSNYSVKWDYATGDGVWFNGEDSTAKEKQALYNAPSNATKVRFKVRPNAKKHKVNGKDVSYWTADYSSWKTYEFETSVDPVTPAVPTVTITKYKLTAEVDDYNTTNLAFEFQVVKNDKSVIKTGQAKKVKNHASFSCTVDAGAEYKVRCRALGNPTFQEGKNGSSTNKTIYASHSTWTEYSANEPTIPATPKGFTRCAVMTMTEVQINWDKVATATSYNIEYATLKRHLGSSNESQKMSVERLHAEITGLDSGDDWYIRLQAVNSKGESGWCDPIRVVLGKKPSAPTTWSSTATALSGEPITLFWMHNSEDGSTQTGAEIEITADGKKSTQTVDGKDSSFGFGVGGDGCTISWRVRTKGITEEYGPWSVARVIKVYAPPTLAFFYDGLHGASFDKVTSFPVPVSVTSGPMNQTPVGYHLEIVSNQVYEDLDYMGRPSRVNAGEQIYSKYINSASHELTVNLGAGDINLKNNVTYTLTCTVSMNSGLTATNSHNFTVAWQEELEYEPNAEIGIDADTLAAHIRPYCEDDDGNLISNILLSVYRREFDGSFTEIATELDNQKGTFVTDPHPALDYARYRVVAMAKDTGAISFCDVPGHPVSEIAVVLQWDEAWSYFDCTNDDEAEQPAWAGSMLKLPYNIDVSDNHQVDVALVEYIGRKHPVSYYGTQLGETASWSVEIEKEDEETLYALRRLAVWMGDVYVREPSGSGYWAQVSVSFSQKHCELTIPVTLDITRVSGGV